METSNNEGAGERNFEADAQRQGWRPKEDFVSNGGSESAWVDAKTFVERGESSAGILKSRLERAERKLEHLSATNESLAKHHNRMLEQESAKRKDLMNQLEDARAQAVADGNSAAFKKADRQLDQLRKEDVATPTPVTTDIDPGIEEWLSENRWYSEDPAMQAMADGYVAQLKRRNPNLKGRPFLEEIGKFVKENFKKEVKPNAKGKDDESSKVPTRESKDNASGDRSYSDLPADAKKECNRLIKQIKGFTKEQFVQYYDWE